MARLKRGSSECGAPVDKTYWAANLERQNHRISVMVEEMC